MNSRRARSAFTLVELLTVIGIILLVAALAAPLLTSFRKGDAMLSATRQMIDAVHRARQLAISQHTTVYLVFAPTNLASQPLYSAVLSPAESNAALSVLEKEQTGYTYVSFRSVGDQPGRGTPRYFTAWQTLPDSIFIPAWKFNLQPGQFRLITDPTDPNRYFVVGPFDQVGIPFPSVEAQLRNPTRVVLVPCLTFDYEGRLVTPNGQPLRHDEFIPLAHGSVLPPRNPATKVPVPGAPDELESPPGNSTNTFNLIRIDWLTGRARLERQEVR